MYSLPTSYQQFIHLSKYSRWKDNLDRRETWEETVDRYFSYFKEKFPNIDLQECQEAVLNLEIVPSMRALMSSGKALEKDNVACYNCLSPETKILTREYGVVPIKDVVGDITLLDGNEKWIKSKIKCFGVQKLVDVIFRLNSNTIISISATLDHEWNLKDGRRIKTKELQPKDIIEFKCAPKKIDEKSIDYRRGVQHGLIYGDGTEAHSCERTNGYMLRICNDKDNLLSWFSEYPVGSIEGDPLVYIYDSFAKTHRLKELPLDSETDNYLVGFFRGWFAADGHCTKSASQCSICVDPEEKKWLKTIMPKFGYWFPSENILPKETNYGIRKKESRNLHIHRSSLSEDDFLINRKRKYFRPLESYFSFYQIKDNGRKIKVYCAIVPSTHSFVLENGLLTGNCAYLTIDDPKVFDEMMYIMMCSTGVGFSVERKYTDKLPEIPRKLYPTNTTIVIEDSKIGWATGYRELMYLLYLGKIPKWDVSKLRPAGARLITFGGRSSGPGPLVSLFEFTIEIFKKAAGRKLNTLECHDIACKLATIVECGGVRRAATISLSDLEDDRMRVSKTGNWWEQFGYRHIANNSAVYEERPDVGIFLSEWKSLYDSKSGERGIFNRQAAQKAANRSGRRDINFDFGTNPCSEILLRPNEFCNLSEVVIREYDPPTDLVRKVRLATILGTIQSTCTNFRYLRPEWKENCETERLLGVSLTGIYDNPITSGKSKTVLQDLLVGLKEEAIATNLKWSKILGINQSVAITCVKPSGNTSQLVDSSSGIHPRYSEYYIRTVRNSKKDPLSLFMRDKGFPVETSVNNPDTQDVFSFPIKSPESSIYRNDISALDQLRLCLTYQKYWCEHKPSTTVYIRESEWMDVGAYIYKNFDDITGIAFLPYDGGNYVQSPYKEINEQEYLVANSKMPKNIDWSELSKYESEDMTEGSKELACVGQGLCEL